MTEPLNHPPFGHTDCHWLSATQCQSVVQIAKEAGAAFMDIYTRGAQGVANTTAVKEDSSSVTEADLAAHQVIVDGLSVVTPEIPVVSEEDADSLVHRMTDKTFWLIDPLDGTKEFIARNGEFTANIALIVNGEPVWGVVHAPALDQTYWGGSHLGAFKQEGTQMRVSLSVNDRRELLLTSPAGGASTAADATIRVVASKSHSNESTEAFIRRLGVVALVQAGSSLKFCKLADGGADIYPRLAPTCEWATAAAQAVVEGAGAYVFDIDGNRLRYGKAELLNPFFIAAACCYTELQAMRKSRQRSEVKESQPETQSELLSKAQAEDPGNTPFNTSANTTGEPSSGSANK
jgi:3'(2'), 5'-bisphosphate nucleotidase